MCSLFFFNLHIMRLYKLNSFSVLLAASILLSAASVSCKKEPDRIEVLQNYSSGAVSRKYFTINGKKEGLMVDYYPDGSLKAERLFENDIQVNKTIIFHKNGAIKEVQYFKDGRVHGGDTIFYENGKPEMVVTFNEGVKNGYVRKWSVDDSLIYEAKYIMDTLVEVKGQAIHPDTVKEN